MKSQKEIFEEWAARVDNGEYTVFEVCKVLCDYDRKFSVWFSKRDPIERKRGGGHYVKNSNDRKLVSSIKKRKQRVITMCEKTAIELDSINSDLDEIEMNARYDLVQEVKERLKNAEHKFTRHTPVDEMSLTDIGRMMGVTRERARQLYFSAMRKVRNKIIIMGLADERKYK